MGQVLDVSDLEFDRPVQPLGHAAGPSQHVGGHVDPGQLDIVGVQTQVAAGTYTHLERLAFGVAEEALAPASDTEKVHGLVVEIVEPGHAVIAGRHRVLVPGGFVLRGIGGVVHWSSVARSRYSSVESSPRA